MFVIYDKKLNELIGSFKTYNDAFFFYMHNNVIERLKLYRHYLMNKEFQNFTITSIRDIENLMESICELLNTEEPNYNYLNTKLQMANSYLNNEDGEKFKITMHIIQLNDDDEPRSIRLI